MLSDTAADNNQELLDHISCRLVMPPEPKSGPSEEGQEGPARNARFNQGLGAVGTAQERRTVGEWNTRTSNSTSPATFRKDGMGAKQESRAPTSTPVLFIPFRGALRPCGSRGRAGHQVTITAGIRDGGTPAQLMAAYLRFVAGPPLSNRQTSAERLRSCGRAAAWWTNIRSKATRRCADCSADTAEKERRSTPLRKEFGAVLGGPCRRTSGTGTRSPVCLRLNSTKAACGTSPLSRGRLRGRL